MKLNQQDQNLTKKIKKKVSYKNVFKFNLLVIKLIEEKSSKLRSEDESQLQYDDLLNFAIEFKPKFNEIFNEGILFIIILYFQIILNYSGKNQKRTYRIKKTSCIEKNELGK